MSINKERRRTGHIDIGENHESRLLSLLSVQRKHWLILEEREPEMASIEIVIGETRPFPCDEDLAQFKEP
ncbi:hypothetical protein SUGI_0329680 [Cryptomeria japonica]|nr:hypothetical protein SUGI_0329680 [Cryptomeria japonica]